MRAQGEGPPLTILGGGPAGLAVAYYAHQAGLRFVLYERAAEPGGLCRTLRVGAHRYDCGAHRFHDRDAEVTRDLRRLLGDRLRAVDAPSQILDRGRFVEFPPTPLGWVRGLGFREAVRVGWDLLRSRARPRPERTFEDHAINRYGRRLGKPLLLDYSEKLWGLPADRLAPDVATRRLSGLTLWTLFGELVPGRRASTHLDGSFLYPQGGYGEIPAGLAAALPPDAVRTNHAVAGLVCEGGAVRAVRFPGRPATVVGGRCVSTLPLGVLVRFLRDAVPDPVRRAAAQLSFRHVRLVFLRLGVARCSRNATIYLPDPRICVSRLSEPKNRSDAMAPAGETGLVAEVPCTSGDALSALDDAALAARVQAELEQVGLIDRRHVLEWRHHFLPNAYPVYALGYPDAVRQVRTALGSFSNLDLLGRGGRFWYSHLHDQMRAAKDYVRSLVEARVTTERVPAHPKVGDEAVPWASFS